MPQTLVNTGSGPNSGTGDSLRDAFTKLNANDADHETRMKAIETLVAATLQSDAVRKAVLTGIVAALPTSLPSTAGVLWRNGQILAIS